MYKQLVKNGQLLAFGLGVVVTLLFLFSVLGGLEDFNMLTKEEKGTTNIFNVGLWAAVIFVILGAAAILLFGVYHTVTNPKGATKFLIGLGVIVVVFLIFYSMAAPIGDGKLFELSQKFNITEGSNKFITGALSTMLVLAGLCAAAFVVSELRNLFK